MKRTKGENTYFVYITRCGSAFAEITVDVRFDGSNWIQTKKSHPIFNQFFLNAIGNAITKAVKKEEFELSS